MSKDIKDALWILAAFAVGFTAGALIKSETDFRSGYIQAIIDNKGNKPLKYVLKTDSDLTVKWVENEEYGK